MPEAAYPINKYLASYIKLIQEYLEDFNPDAALWILGYAAYVHRIDDTIDDEVPKSQNARLFLLDTFEFAEHIYSNHFYIQNLSKLRPLIKMTALGYRDTIILEEGKESWKAQVTDHLRCVGNEILLAVIEIVRGIDVKREVSPKLRELSWHTHHALDGRPI